MLVHLSVHNYAIVEHLDLELATGMSVITGETGAGKSIMLDALGLTLGDRADSGAVRPGADKADILASFDVSAIAEARDWLAERDLEQDGPCILRRVITAEGRSRAYINGTPCPLGDLKSLGELLIDIHSQHEHQSLLKSETHRRLLDEYAGCQELARQVQLAAQRWKQTSQELERLSRSGDEQRARHQLLSYQLENWKTCPSAKRTGKPGAGAEDPEQRRKPARRLPPSRGNVQRERCRQRPFRAQCQPQPPDLVQRPARRSRRSGQSVVQRADPGRGGDRRTEPLRRPLRCRSQSPAAGRGAPGRHLLLARKHRVQPAELADLQRRLFDELEALNADDEAVGRLGDELAAYARHYQEKAEELSRLRQAAAAPLAASVEQEMQRLGMPGGASPSSCIPATAPSRRPTDWKAWSSWSAPTPGSR